MRTAHRSWPVPGLLLAALFSPPASADEPPGATEALRQFQKAWTPLKGRAYMRPPDDVGWKRRLGSLRALARAGDKATTVLVDALKKGDDDTRVFAAQVLSLVPTAGARESLVSALKDSQPAVRLYALNGLSVLGEVPRAVPYLTLQKKDPNGDVRANAGFAMGRDDKADPEAVRKALADYDPRQMATATLGKQAPDFTLTGADGKRVRLSDYRGKKAVVIVFIYGDT